MSSLVDLILEWPLARQILERKDGTGLEAMSAKTREMHARIDNAKVAKSVCPYCGVGCGQLIYHKHGRLVAIEGDPESPISQGNLCPKGAASFQLLTHSRRETKVKYRAPARERVERRSPLIARWTWWRTEFGNRASAHSFARKMAATVNHTTAICSSRRRDAR